MNQDEIKEAIDDAIAALFHAHAKVEALADAYRDAGDQSAAVLTTIHIDTIEDVMGKIEE